MARALAHDCRCRRHLAVELRHALGFVPWCPRVNVGSIAHAGGGWRQVMNRAAERRAASRSDSRFERRSAACCRAYVRGAVPGVGRRFNRRHSRCVQVRNTVCSHLGRGGHSRCRSASRVGPESGPVQYQRRSGAGTARESGRSRRRGLAGNQGWLARGVADRICEVANLFTRERSVASVCAPLWGRSSVGRALRSQCRGQGFDPPRFHQYPPLASDGRGRATFAPDSAPADQGAAGSASQTNSGSGSLPSPSLRHSDQKRRRPATSSASSS